MVLMEPIILKIGIMIFNQLKLPTTTVQERIEKKLIQKSLFEFNKTATETAINIIKGIFLL